MSNKQDKNVSSNFGRRDVRPRRKNVSFISDTYTKMEACGEPRSSLPSWETEVGRRLEIIVDGLGKDKSVQLVGRSWKQLQRYFEGAEVPSVVVATLATATKTSTDYILDGNVTTSMDADIQRKIIERKLIFVREAIKNSTEKPQSAELHKLHKLEQIFIDGSSYYAKVGAALLNRPIRKKSLEEYIDPTIVSSQEVDPDVVREIQKSLGVLGKDPQKATIDEVAPPLSGKAPSFDEDLMAAVARGIEEVYVSENARIYPVQLVQAATRMYAELIEAYDTREECMVGLKGALHRLRRDLRAPTDGASGKRSA